MKNIMEFDKAFEMTSLLIPMLRYKDLHKSYSNPMVFGRKANYKMTTLLEILKTGVERSQSEPDFISKYPSFVTLVGLIGQEYIDNHIDRTYPLTVFDIIETIPSSVLYDISLKLLENGETRQASIVIGSIEDPSYSERIKEFRKKL